VIAVVEPAGDGELTADALVAHVARRLADYKKPRGIVFVPGVQRSPSGKADLRWAQAVATGGAGPRRPAGPGRRGPALPG
jgi:3-oxocholest-4-en-26-oate---CoA ligase